MYTIFSATVNAFYSGEPLSDPLFRVGSEFQFSWPTATPPLWKHNIRFKQALEEFNYFTLSLICCIQVREQSSFFSVLFQQAPTDIMKHASSTRHNFKSAGAKSRPWWLSGEQIFLSAAHTWSSYTPLYKYKYASADLCLPPYLSLLSLFQSPPSTAKKVFNFSAGFGWSVFLHKRSAEGNFTVKHHTLPSLTQSAARMDSGRSSSPNSQWTHKDVKSIPVLTGS